MRQTVYVQRLSDLATLPTRGSEEAAGMDLYAALETDVEIAPHSTVKIPTDLAFALPKNTFGAIFARSGLATKQGLRPANCVGVADSDYRGNYIVALHNDTDEVKRVLPGDRVAQLVLMPYIPMELVEVDVLDETDRGADGFGSTGR
jgi:dUTP pyrophosphatase